VNPVEIVQYLLDENGLTKSQFAAQLEVSRQLITDILNYRRNISKTIYLTGSSNSKESLRELELTVAQSSHLIIILSGVKTTT